MLSMPFCFLSKIFHYCILDARITYIPFSLYFASRMQESPLSLVTHFLASQMQESLLSIISHFSFYGCNEQYFPIFTFQRHSLIQKSLHLYHRDTTCSQYCFAEILTTQSLIGTIMYRYTKVIVFIVHIQLLITCFIIQTWACGICYGNGPEDENRGALHMLNEHVINSLCLKCPCGSEFHTQFDLSQHVRSVHLIYLFVCNVCGLTCSHGSDARVHIRQHN